MILRKKIAFIMITLWICVTLCACRADFSSPADEIRLFSWRGETENGNTAELSFVDDEAVLTAHSDKWDVQISGLCALTDHTLVICDTNSEMNYTFRYQIHGDRIELTYDSGTIVLDKISA